MGNKLRLFLLLKVLTSLELFFVSLLFFAVGGVFVVLEIRSGIFVLETKEFTPATVLFLLLIFVVPISIVGSLKFYKQIGEWRIKSVFLIFLVFTFFTVVSIGGFVRLVFWN